MDQKEIEKIRKDNDEIPVLDGWVQMSNFFMGMYTMIQIEKMVQ